MYAKFKQNRGISFAVVGIIYAAAAVVGALVYRLLSFDFWLNLLIADVAATAFVFIFSVALGNASVYDPYWSVQPPVILAAFGFGAELNLTRVLLLVAVFFWGIRLTANWAYTFHGLDSQDWRYTMLKEKTGMFYPVINFLGIHLVPTLVVWGCILPAVFLFKFDCGANTGSWIFFVMSVGAAVLQGCADIQMHRFRRKKTGGFIRTGLWKHSRHPNYLGEILMWWGVALSAVCVMPERWYLCAGAAANTLLFLCVSIPMAEKRQSRKPGYEAYRRETFALVGIPRKHRV